MNAAALILLVLAGAAAAADWVAVWRRPALERAETVLKPAVLLALIGVALTVDPVHDGQRAWFVVALVFSLAGDVFLLPAIDRFVPGLASFLLAHVAFVIGFWLADGEANAGLGALVVLAVIAFRIVSAVRRSAPDLLIPVIAYIVVIASMLTAAIEHRDGVGIAGAALFATSDSILALDRFEQHRRWMPLAVMVTYHLAQAFLVASLV
jgi:uncharacterized membrane protein YhhN